MRAEGRRLWGIPSQIATRLEQEGKPVATAWDLFVQIRMAYHTAGREIPSCHDLYGICYELQKAGTVAPDRDYSGHYRVCAVSDLPADDIVCLLDHFCCISHLSAMQKWGLTDRQPHELMITRPDDATVRKMVTTIMDEEAAEVPWKNRPPRNRAAGPFRMTNIIHPRYVRQRPVQLHKSRHVINAVRDRNGFARVTAIGQTFLDMLRRPGLCGGMAHVLKVWDGNAGNYLNDIIAVVDSTSAVVKCRAGYILEERLGLNDSRVTAWRSSAQRGGSRRLDPGRPYVPIWSETWMISLNA